MLGKTMERLGKLFREPGAPLHKLWPLFDAVGTFLFTPARTAPKRGPHVRDYIDLKRVMWTVIVALVPCLLFSIYNIGYQHFTALASVVTGEGGPYPEQIGWLQSLVFGSGYAPNIGDPAFSDIVVFGLQKLVPILFVSYFVGLNIEGLFAILRKEEISEGYLVTGILIALIVPPSIPLWQLALAVAFAVVLAKEVFGGTGQNIFNVALMARAFLFFAYPAQMSGDFVWVGGNAKLGLIDGYSGPTALSLAANAKLAANHLPAEGIENLVPSAAAAVEAKYSFWDMFVGLVPGSIGETSTLCILLGALLLVATGVASWRTMVSGVVGLVVMALAMNLLAGDLDGIGGFPPHWHLVSGGFAFGIVFMATDPVSSPETNRGKWIYGFLIGAMTVLVRAVNPAYPEGTMLAILLLNAFAPTIDYFVMRGNVARRKARLAR